MMLTKTMSDGIEIFYLKEYRKIKRISLSQRDQLVKAAINGDLEAKRKLIENHIPLVFKIAKNYRGRGIDWMDLIQEGSLALCKAFEDYKPEKSLLVTHASYRIHGAIRDLVRKKTIVASEFSARQLKKINQFQESFYKLRGYMPNTDEIEQEFRFRKGTAREVLNTEYPVSLDERHLVREDFKGSSTSTSVSLLELLPDSKTVSPSEIFEIKELRSSLEKALKTLRPINRKNIYLRFGLDDNIPQTYKFIGEKTNQTAVAVHIMNKRTLKRLKTKQDHLRIYLQ